MIQKEERRRFTLRLPDKLFEKLNIEADRRGVSINSMILEILWEWAEKNNVE